MTDSIATIGFFQQIGQDVKRASFTPVSMLTAWPGSEVSLRAAGKAGQRSWPGTCITPDNWTSQLGLKTALQHWHNFAQIVTLQQVLQACSDCYTGSDTIVFIVRDAVMLLNSSLETPASGSAEGSLPVSGCCSTLWLLFDDHLCLDHCSMRRGRLYILQIALSVAGLQPRSYHKAWDKNEETPGKDLLLL